LALSQKSFDGSEYKISVSDVDMNDENGEISFFVSGYESLDEKPFAEDSLVSLKLKEGHVETNNNTLLEAIGNIEVKYQRLYSSYKKETSFLQSLVNLVFPSAHAQAGPFNGYAENYGRGNGRYNNGYGGGYGNGPAPDQLLGGGRNDGGGYFNNGNSSSFNFNVNLTALNVIVIIVGLLLAVQFSSKAKPLFLITVVAAAALYIDNNFINTPRPDDQFFRFNINPKEIFQKIRSKLGQ